VIAMIRRGNSGGGGGSGFVAVKKSALREIFQLLCSTH